MMRLSLTSAPHHTPVPSAVTQHCSNKPNRRQCWALTASPVLHCVFPSPFFIHDSLTLSPAWMDADCRAEWFLLSRTETSYLHILTFLFFSKSTSHLIILASCKSIKCSLFWACRSATFAFYFYFSPETFLDMTCHMRFAFVTDDM